MGSMLTKNLLLVDSKRQKLKKSPKEYGMEKFESVEFESNDKVKLKAWVIPGKKDFPVIIVTHPMPMTRYGFDVKQQGMFKFTKCEVELLRTCKVLNSQGYSIVTFDFRNHGESGKSNDGYTGIGLFEYNDVLGCLDYVSKREDFKGLPIGFASHCCGANATIIALSKGKEKFKNVKCLFLVQPVSMSYLVPGMLKTSFPLFKGCYNSMNKKAKSYTKHTFEEMSPLQYMKDIKMPVFLSQVKVDAWTKIEDVQTFYEAIGKDVPKELFWIEGKDIKERFDGYNYFANNPDKMLGFFKKYLSKETVEEEKKVEGKLNIVEEVKTETKKDTTTAEVSLEEVKTETKSETGEVTIEEGETKETE